MSLLSRTCLAALSATLLLAACSPAAPSAALADDATATAVPSAIPSAPPVVAEVAPAAPTATAAHDLAVTLVFGGDVHAEPPIASVLARGDSPLDPLAGELTAADLAVVNVETAVGVLGSPADKQYTFQAPASLWPALRASGVDVVNLANNHALDYGPDALAETIAGARAAGLTVVGAGANAAEAYAPALLQVNDRTVAVVGLTRVMPAVEWGAGTRRPGLASAYDTAAAAAAVRAAARQAEHVVVTIHWGAEGEPCPVAHQHELAELLVEAGADVVAGHHAHRLQGIERRGGALVAYGLGNLVFYGSSDTARTTGLLRVTLDESGPREPVLVPARIDAEGVPHPLTGAAARAVVDEVATLTPGGGTCPSR